jgi:dUTP pyrophosphatase
MDEVMLNNDLQTFIQAIQELIDMDEEDFEEPKMMDAVMIYINKTLTPLTIKQSVDQIIRNLELEGATRDEARAAMDALKEFINEMVYGEHQYSNNKKKILDTILNSTFDIFDRVVEKYHVYAIELPMTVAEGAKVPTYAHETDAAADLYAMEDEIIGAQSCGTKLRTGVSIQLPEGWLALIIPRSSIGAKTPLRLSNSVGLIDSGYRGELGVLYDNLTPVPYTVHKGDRIAQLLVMPSYRFKAEVVDTLEDSDRGEGGFGSTGT